MLHVSYASVPGSADVANQDYVLADDQLICVLDGVTPPSTGLTGCVHGVRWYVEMVARFVLHAGRGGTLPEILARAIDQVRLAHQDTCDLGHPDTPSAAVAILRAGPSSADYLVLCDCAVVLDLGGEVTVHTDATNHVERARRATAGGPLWKAGALPEAAFSAVAGQAPVCGSRGLRRAALLTDGVTRAVAPLGLFTWPGLLDELSQQGASCLLTMLRQAERTHDYTAGTRPVKTHDDATAVVCHIR